MGLARHRMERLDGSRNPQTERSLTILHIKKLGREIDWEGISCGGGGDREGGKNMGKPENGPAALQSMDNDVRPLTPSR